MFQKKQQKSNGLTNSMGKWDNNSINNVNLMLYCKGVFLVCFIQKEISQIKRKII